MSTTVRRRIAAACVIIGFLVIGASIGGLFTGYANYHAVTAITFSAISILGALTYLRSSRGRR